MKVDTVCISTNEYRKLIEDVNSYAASVEYLESQIARIEKALKVGLRANQTTYIKEGYPFDPQACCSLQDFCTLFGYDYDLYKRNMIDEIQKELANGEQN